MANQLHVHEQNAISHRLQIDAIRAERDTALHDRDSIRNELDATRSRLDSVQKAWQNTRNELDQRENHFSSNDSHLKKLENDLLYAKTSFDAFKQQVGQLLSDGYVKVEPKEDEIKEKIHLLMQSSKDRGVVSSNFIKTKFFLKKLSWNFLILIQNRIYFQHSAQFYSISK